MVQVAKEGDCGWTRREFGFGLGFVSLTEQEGEEKENNNQWAGKRREGEFHFLW